MSVFVRPAHPLRRAARPLRASLSKLLLLALTGAPMGCEDGNSSTAGSSAPSDAVASSASVGPSASASAPAPAPEPPAHPLAGRWKTQFQAERGTVDIREGIPYRPWVKDDGSASAGKGELSLTVADDGAVTGEGAGALGAMALRGRADEKVVRAGVTPADASAPGGMRGILVVELTGDDLVGQLRVSNADGTVVRVADVRFER